LRYDPPGRLRTAVDFRARWREIDPSLDCDVELLGADGPLGAPIDAIGRTLANRFCVHPMEGWDGTRGGLPSELTLRRWRNFGRSGAALVWGGEAFAVQADGRANPNQLFLNDEADVAGALVRLREQVLAGRAEVGEEPDAVVLGLQLTHSGRFARPTPDGGAPRIAYHHPVLDERFRVPSSLPPLSDFELGAIGERFVRAACLAADAGYDFVDVKCCHGYLLHELLSARVREGPYGGSLEGRTRLFREIVAGIRAERPDLPIGVRLSLADVFPYSPDPQSGVGAPRGLPDQLPYVHGFGVDADDPLSFDLEEPFAFLELLQELDIELVNVTLGSPYYCPHLQRPAAYPPSDGYEPPEDPLASVARHLLAVREVKARFPELVLVGTGYTYLQEWLPHVAQHEVGHGHVDLVGIGRMVLSYPELPLDVLAGRPLDRRRICRTFSDCTTAPRNGLPSGCYPLDQRYMALPEAARLRDIKEGHA
jgi:2,4-dienoyl-CoA reductase-like NADH-dependent reductase (Old Yellow Enzyme family)